MLYLKSELCMLMNSWYFFLSFALFQREAGEVCAGELLSGAVFVSDSRAEIQLYPFWFNVNLRELLIQEWEQRWLLGLSVKGLVLFFVLVTWDCSADCRVIKRADCWVNNATSVALFTLPFLHVFRGGEKKCNDCNDAVYGWHNWLRGLLNDFWCVGSSKPRSCEEDFSSKFPCWQRV